MYDFNGVQGAGFFGIFDGHAGQGAAKWCELNFPMLLGRIVQDEKRAELGTQQHLSMAFVEADERLAEDPNISSGCTAAVALFKPALAAKPNGPDEAGTLYTANVGDARIILCHAGRAVRLTYDHKATDRREQTRIREAGGFVAHDRVSGVLAVTRALGDEELKDFVIGRPFTAKVAINSAVQFLIIACDGLWDVMDDQEAVDMVRHGLAQPLEDPPSASGQPEAAAAAVRAADQLVNHAIKEGSTDNITVMVVLFRHP